MLPLLRLIEFYSFLGAVVKITNISFLDAVTLYGLGISNKMVSSEILLTFWYCPMVLFNILSGRSLSTSRMYLKMSQRKFSRSY